MNKQRSTLLIIILIVLVLLALLKCTFNFKTETTEIDSDFLELAVAGEGNDCPYPVVFHYQEPFGKGRFSDTEVVLPKIAVEVPSVSHSGSILSDLNSSLSNLSSSLKNEMTNIDSRKTVQVYVQSPSLSTKTFSLFIYTHIKNSQNVKYHFTYPVKDSSGIKVKTDSGSLVSNTVSKIYGPYFKNRHKNSVDQGMRDKMQRDILKLVCRKVNSK